MTSDREAVFATASDWLGEGERVAWATVVGTWSSSPRPLGSQMAIAESGRFAGSVSGGCVESAVLVAAGEVFAGGPARVLRYGVSTEQAWEVGLPCGGTIEVHLGEASRPLVERLVEARARRQSVARVIDLVSGNEEMLEPGRAGASWGGSRAGDAGPAELARAVEQALHREQSQLIELAGRRLFVHVVAAPLRLVVVGAVHLTQALAELAMLSGIDVTVVDPRTAFASAERFPGVTLSHEWPDAALEGLRLDRRSAVVVLSHDAKLDEPALQVALRNECFYIGALGSQRTQAARRARLGESGFGEDVLRRIHGPVGLDIGALTTPEIAISIMAELIRAWRQRPEPAGAAR
ncbi:MAG TPA: XdhC/CoxI family protein [Polyangiaceae bacterium]|nr:XdhC/CoxI family protein [Polyangiaceae bacterium]